MLSLFSRGAFADSIGLTGDNLRTFNQNKLSIEIRGKGMGGGTVGYGGSVTVSLETWNQWIAYRGFEKISEADFYHLTGYPDAAVKAEGHQKITRTFIISGIAGLLGSLLTIPLAMDGGVGGLSVCMGLLVTGGVCMPIGMTRLNKNWAAAASAQDMAHEYNRELADRIIAGEF